jgi:hypothetical protein
LVLADRAQVIERTLATAYPTTRKSRMTYSLNSILRGLSRIDAVRFFVPARIERRAVIP